MRNQREIGSEFWCVPTGESENIFPNDTKWFISGRSALQAIIQENDFKTVWMPDWCCESMLRPFGDAGINIKFYPVIEGVEWENVLQEHLKKQQSFVFQSLCFLFLVVLECKRELFL